MRTGWLLRTLCCYAAQSTGEHEEHSNSKSNSVSVHNLPSSCHSSDHKPIDPVPYGQADQLTAKSSNSAAARIPNSVVRIVEEFLNKKLQTIELYALGMAQALVERYPPAKDGLMAPLPKSLVWFLLQKADPTFVDGFIAALDGHTKTLLIGAMAGAGRWDLVQRYASYIAFSWGAARRDALQALNQFNHQFDSMMASRSNFGLLTSAKKNFTIPNTYNNRAMYEECHAHDLRFIVLAVEMILLAESATLYNFVKKMHARHTFRNSELITAAIKEGLQLVVRNLMATCLLDLLADNFSMSMARTWLLAAASSGSLAILQDVFAFMDKLSASHSNSSVYIHNAANRNDQWASMQIPHLIISEQETTKKLFSLDSKHHMFPNAFTHAKSKSKRTFENTDLMKGIDQTLYFDIIGQLNVDEHTGKSRNKLLKRSVSSFQPFKQPSQPSFGVAGATFESGFKPSNLKTESDYKREPSFLKIKGVKYQTMENHEAARDAAKSSFYNGSHPVVPLAHTRAKSYNGRLSRDNDHEESKLLASNTVLKLGQEADLVQTVAQIVSYLRRGWNEVALLRLLCSSSNVWALTLRVIENDSLVATFPEAHGAYPRCMYTDALISAGHSLVSRELQSQGMGPLATHLKDGFEDGSISESDALAICGSSRNSEGFEDLNEKSGELASEMDKRQAVLMDIEAHLEPLVAIARALDAGSLWAVLVTLGGRRKLLEADVTMLVSNATESMLSALILYRRASFEDSQHIVLFEIAALEHRNKLGDFLGKSNYCGCMCNHSQHLREYPHERTYPSSLDAVHFGISTRLALEHAVKIGCTSPLIDRLTALNISAVIIAKEPTKETFVCTIRRKPKVKKSTSQLDEDIPVLSTSPSRKVSGRYPEDEEMRFLVDVATGSQQTRNEGRLKQSDVIFSVDLGSSQKSARTMVS